MGKTFSIIAIIFIIIGLGCSPLKSNLESEFTDNREDRQYIVVFKKSKVDLSLKSTSGLTAMGAVQAMAAHISETHELSSPSQIFSQVISAGVYKLSSKQLENLSNDPLVAYIEEDQIISINNVQSNVTWGLDRIDQVNLPLDQKYNYILPAVPVNIYVIDTGILNTHVDFQGRARNGADLVDQDGNSTDCNGHGTHVAGTIGGASYGVVKNANLYGVRVLDCSGSGTNSDVIAGIEWVTKNHIKPAVANMSLGGGASAALDEAIKASIRSGVTYVVAAGNSNVSACNGSPSRVPEAITVGSSTNNDSRSSFSNYGTCVDLFAPGSDIKSAWYNSNTATSTISGTSMAAPHVAGVAALYLSQHPQALPQEVQSAILSGSLSGKITNAGTGSPNRLLSSLFILDNDEEEEDLPEEDPQLQRLVNNTSVSGLSGEKAGERYFAIDIPKGVSRLTIETSGGSGDADLYVKFSEKPNVTKYECRPFTASNKEKCSFNNPAQGRWYVLLRGFRAYTGVSLKAIY